MKTKFFLLLSTFLFFVISLHSQPTDKSVSPEVWKIINETNLEKEKGSGAVILLKEDILTVDRKKRATEVFHIVGKILDQKARLDFAQIPMMFNSYYEDVTVNFARSIRPDGSVAEVFPDAIMIESLPQMEGGIHYSDMKALTFSLPALDIGVAFEYQITIRQKKSVIEGAWFMEHTFNYLLRKLASPYTIRMDPVVQSRLSIRVPRGDKFQWSMQVDSIQPAVMIGKELDEYRWDLHHLPETKFESGMPSLNDLAIGIVLSSLRSWKQIDQWAANKFLPPKRINETIRKTAATVTLGASTDEEKIERLYHFIQREVKYVGADLARGGYTPHKPESVLKNRYGDCKDQTFLFITLLSAAGIKAYPALLNPFMYSEQIITPAPFFSHVITYIPMKEKDLWLDSTPGVTPFPLLYVTNQNRQALIIDGLSGRFIKTPGSTARENEYIFRFTIVRNETRGDAVVEFRGKGAASDGLKQMFMSMDKEQSYRCFQSLILYQYKNAFVDSVRVSDVQNPEVPFKAVVYCHLDSVWTGKFSRFYYDGNSKLALAFFINEANYPHPDTRHYSMNLVFPFTITGYETFPRPSMSFSETYLPDDDSLEMKYLRCYRKFEKSFSGAEAQWSITQPQTVIALQDYKSFYEDIDRMKNLMHWSIVFYIPYDQMNIR